MVAVLWWSYKLVWNRDTQQGEKATERRKDREAERIKNALYSKDLQGRNEGEEKGKQDREQRA